MTVSDRHEAERSSAPALLLIKLTSKDFYKGIENLVG